MKCQYRNCDKDVGEGRSDKVYCDQPCRRNEKKYRQRTRQRIRKKGKKDI